MLLYNCNALYGMSSALLHGTALLHSSSRHLSLFIALHFALGEPGFASLALLAAFLRFTVTPGKSMKNLSLCRLPNMFLAGLLTVCFFFWYLCMLATG